MMRLRTNADVRLARPAPHAYLTTWPMLDSATRSAKSDCLFLFLTQRCNLACAHCYVSASPWTGLDMELTTARAALQIFRGLDIQDVRLTGGEPTIHPAFEEVLATARAAGFAVGLLTNGAKLMRLAWGRRIVSQIARCWVSVYGMTAEIHRAVGGAAAPDFERLLGCVGAYGQLGHSIGLSVLVTPGSARFANEMMSKASHAGVRRLRFIPAQPDGRGSSLSATWYGWERELCTLIDVLKSDPSAGTFESLTVNDPFDLRDRGIARGASCLISRRRMWSVTPDGSVYPCCFTAYQDSLRICGVHDSDAIARLAGGEIAALAGSRCRAFSPGFWRDVEPTCVTCPISRGDPRTLGSANSEMKP